ncbi:MAG: PSD1 and planctomycete cytochrome C domain-containing protein [Planctomycetota bacterium]
MNQLALAPQQTQTRPYSAPQPSLPERRLLEHLLLLGWLLALAFSTNLSPAQLHGAEPSAPTPASAAVNDYQRRLKPLLRERCYACHAGLKQEAGLRLDTAELIRQGGTDGAIVRSDNLPASKLLERVRSTDLTHRMPPEGMPLSGEQIALLERWIAAGAPGPVDERAERDPREHWSFRPPQRSPLPDLQHPDWARNEIDRFIGEQLERNGLAPRREAAPEVWLRRVTLDLTGLPPTLEQTRDFLADKRPDAYERLVDRLLNSPLYGERWARHWMDVWRYSDWFGRRMVPDVWNSAPQIWRWRDWIVNSLNQDLGYDQMVQAMLAADEIFPTDDQHWPATGFLIRNWYALNPNQWMRDNVEHTAKAFLGLTFQCAHCHDHKYDPIAQQDYFRFRAFFEPLAVRQDRVVGEPDPGLFQEYEYSTLRKIIRQGMVRVYDKNLDAPTWFYTGGDERNRVKDKGAIAPGLPAVLTAQPLAITPLDLPSTGWYPGLRPAVIDTEISSLDAAVKQAEGQVAESRQSAADAITAARAACATADANWQKAIHERRAAGQLTALTGHQSLCLRASTGRRVLANSLRGLTALPAGTTLTFQLRIITDTHVNFQLAKDSVKGLTAACIVFEAGRIRSYQPGGFTEFDVGRYDFAGGQRHFEVRLALDPAQDQARLTVIHVADGQRLVDATPVALNGWNPIGDPTKGISFDARAGSVAAIDEVTVWRPSAAAPDPANNSPLPGLERVLKFDFEEPVYREGVDVTGIEGWEVSPFGTPPGSSEVTSVLEAPLLQPLRQQRLQARAALESAELVVQAAEAALSAAQAQRKAFAARVSAARGRWEQKLPADQLEPLERIALESEQLALQLAAQSNWLASRRALAAAQARPESDMQRAKAIEAATQQVVNAQKGREQPSGLRQFSPLSPVYAAKSSGRRQALAHWITDRSNPLAARVAVNHLWMRHFHEPLVATVFDLGRNGTPPTHPALLDWLAVDWMDAGWNMKRLHKQLVLSATYRQSSDPAAPAAWDEAPRASDVEKKLLSRMRVGRLEAELVRDSLLSLGGLLDLRRGGQELENSEALTSQRRTLYYSCHPEMGGKSSLGELFDAPDPTDCYRRSRSVTPQQALVLTNSSLAHEVSVALVQQLEREWATNPEPVANDEAFIRTAFEWILNRPARPAELQVCRNFLSRQTSTIAAAEPAQAARRARESLVRALLNHNDFIAIR